MKEFEECVRKNKLVRFSRGNNIAEKKLDEAAEDIKEAAEGVEKGKYKWATVQAYYAMFAAGNALLMKKGWREKGSHFCLVAGLKKLYVEEKEIDILYLEAIQKGKVLRESANYQNEWSEDECRMLVSKAQDFVNLTEKILGEK
ncbi:MAG: HEPN domain-containing protein [bacterium]